MAAKSGDTRRGSVLTLNVRQIVIAGILGGPRSSSATPDLPQAIAEAILAAVVTVVVVRGVMVYLSGRTTAPETKRKEEERRY